LDTTNPAAVAWLRDKLDSLILDIRVDGFKFDAGDFGAFRNTDICFQPTHANGHCEAWAKIGLSYPLNEYRACWKQAGQPLVQRLSDKRHSWERATGIGSLIPNGLAQGLMGYAFTCPDMIGGGEYISFLENSGDLDQELVVRSAQCAALFPMMQFSAAPWRILDDEHLKACIDAARIHVEFADEIERLAWEAAKTGEPIIRHMAYVFPDAGLERVDDQFMLGDDVLVAPVQTKGTYSRSVQFPPGKWHGDDGSHVEGPCVLVIDAPLSRLPYFRRA
jgi:alpha-glucosidase (family GH31 glycosyl hydrolase)